MTIVLIRSLILYFLVIFAVRLMGKRQIGELQPTELVITILVSNITTLPLEDVSIPLIVGITPILSLVCFEVIMSWLSLKYPKFRKVLSGQPKIIISNGKIDRKIMQELRFSVDDLMTALRTDGIFDINEVQYAIVETTGSVSVMKKQTLDTPTRSDAGIMAENSNPPNIVISDGKIIEKALKPVGMDMNQLNSLLKKRKLRPENIFIMTADSSGNYYIAKKEKKPDDKS